MGNGISKSTWGSSDPTKCAEFIKKYIPAKEAADDCKNGKCECATQGRFQLKDYTSFGGFGIHTINCTAHPYGEHSLKDIEDMIAKETGDFKSFHPFMDYNLGMWSPDLSDYAIKFDKDNIPMTRLKWKSDDGKTYYSLIVNACGYVNFELMGSKVDDTSKFTETDKMRFSFSSRNQRPTH